MKSDIGISEKNLQAVAGILNQLLADEHILFIKTRNYHWNVEGGNFMELHKFFEGQYTELAEAIDEVAERVRKLGHFAEARLKDYLKLASLEEGEYTNDPQKQIKNLLEDHETVIRSIRKSIPVTGEEHKDAGTADFLTGLLKEHEKWAWMLRAYLK